VDRIAERAQVNKRMIYAYFGNKEALFETVITHSLEDLLDAVPIQVDDLPAYAGQLFDYLIAIPNGGAWLYGACSSVQPRRPQRPSRPRARSQRCPRRPHDRALDGGQS